MDINWQKIWEKKAAGTIINPSLSELINLNGFDNGCGTYGEAQWETMVEDFIVRTGLKKRDKILELGCGSGAFLHSLNQTVSANYFGLDYSLPLVNVAKQVLKRANIICSDAEKDAFGDEQFDIIFSHSVFHYFKDVDYAYKVLNKWLPRIYWGGKLVLMDLNDIDFREEYHVHRKRMSDLPDAYEKNYGSLKHLFFNKNNLKNELFKLGMRNIEFFPHSVNGYGNSKFRFNVMCTKAEGC